MKFLFSDEATERRRAKRAERGWRRWREMRAKTWKCSLWRALTWMRVGAINTRPRMLWKFKQLSVDFSDDELSGKFLAFRLWLQQHWAAAESLSLALTSLRAFRILQPESERNKKLRCDENSSTIWHFAWISFALVPLTAPAHTFAQLMKRFFRDSHKAHNGIRGRHMTDGSNILVKAHPTRPSLHFSARDVKKDFLPFSPSLSL